MNHSLTLHLMGTFAIELNGRSVTQLRSQTTEALLIYLIAHKQPLRREHLADFFWDGRSHSQAAANLRAVLSNMRKHLDDYLIITRHTVAFNHEQDYWVDALALEKSLQEELRADTPDIEQLERALALYRGDFLAGFHLSESPGFETWAAIRGERLHRLASLAWERVVTNHHEQGNYYDGLHQAERWVDIDPLNETAQRQCMWLLARNGRRSAALMQYEQCRRILQEELNINPAPATTAVYDRLQNLAWPPPHNLPIFPGPFIGRETERIEMTALLLNGQCTLLTLLGSGGDGKTRLAVEFGRRLAKKKTGRFLDGIFFLSLATLQDAHSFDFLLAETLNAPASGRGSTHDHLLAHLAGKEMLLILDNFETLLGETGNGRSDSRHLLADILRAAPDTRLLITSRERLQMRQEVVLPLHGLSYPPQGDAHAADYESVQLFLRHARRVLPDFAPVTADLDAIAAICRRLRGMPLGIELAAPILQQTTAVALQHAIDQSPDILTAAWPDVEPRHHSIRAVFNYSWSRLQTGEQQLMARLTIFPGSFTAVASQTICDAGRADLHILAAKSLLQQDKYGRYSIHPLVRALAAEHLPENQTLLEQFYRFYTAYLDQEKIAITGQKQKAALSRVQSELDNIRLAWQLAVKQRDFVALDMALPALYVFFDTRGWFQEGEQLLHQATSQIETKAPSWRNLNEEEALVYGRILSRQAWFTYKLGDFAPAQRLLQKCEQLFLHLEAEPELAHVLNDQGVIARRTGDLPAARLLCLQSLEIRRRIGGRTLVSTLINLANIERSLGQFQTAQRRLLEANELLQKEPEPIYQASVLNDLGEVMRAMGDYESAKNYYLQSLALYREVGDVFGTGASLINLGFVAYQQEALEQAQEYAIDALAAFKAINNRRTMTYPITLLGRIAQDKKDFDTALTSYQEALELANNIKYIPKLLNILFEMATLLAALQDTKTALALLTLIQAQTQTDQETRTGVDVYLSKLTTEMGAETAVIVQQQYATWSLAEAIAFMLVYVL